MTRELPTGKTLGTLGEAFVSRLLRARGYEVETLPVNNPTYDLLVKGERDFFVSVKVSRDKQHVRMGTRRSVERLCSNGYLIAILPLQNNQQVTLEERKCHILVIPALTARDDTLSVLNAYIDDRADLPESQKKDYGFSLMVKGYRKKPYHQEVWSRWMQTDHCWSQLPPPRASTH